LRAHDAERWPRQRQPGAAPGDRRADVAQQYWRDAEFFIGSPKSWGLTFMINEEQAPTGRSAGSLAWAGLANTYMWIDRKRGVAGVYLTQILPFVAEKAFPLYLAFEKAVYQSLG